MAEGGRGAVPVLGELSLSWEKKVKVVSLPLPTKKGLASKSTKSKSAKKGKGATTNAPEAYLEIVPYREGLPLIGSIVIESTPPSSVRTRSARRFVVAKSRPPLPRQPSDALPSSRTHDSKRKTSPLVSSAASERKVRYL